MSTTTIEETFIINGAPTDVTSVVLRDPTAAYGVRRMDNSAVVVAAGTALVHNGTGQYSYTFTDPAAGLVYDYWIEFVYQGQTYRFEKQQSGPGANPAACYLAVPDADAIAANYPGLASYGALNASQKLLHLQLASQDVDGAMRYQGRKYDPTQTLEFPRVLFDGGGRIPPNAWDSIQTPPPAGTEVADWDGVNLVAVVPPAVLAAVVFQADAIAAGTRSGRLDAIHDGIRVNSTGGASEQYDSSAPGAYSGLCRRAWQLMRRYELKSGRLL